MTPRLCFITLTCVMLASSAPADSATEPLAVSPGSPVRSALIAYACPAFSWAAVPDATGYELVLYRLGDATAEPELVSHQRIEGAALAWTPPLERCLEPGGRYAWAVRARVGDRASEWSPPNLFEVTAAPTERELDAALEIVQRYAAARERAFAPEGCSRSTTSAPRPRSRPRASVSARSLASPASAGCRGT